jgi:hypothetical protein
MTGKTLRQCRECWLNCPSPEITNAPWTAQEEEEILKHKVFEFGASWNPVRRFLRGRSAISAV